jgi:D-serine deaminase-like pyridoxal phosphate-dependent protein
MVDHPSQIEAIAKQRSLFPIRGSKTPVYIKVDTGYGRAGVTAESKTFKAIYDTLDHPYVLSEVQILGLYSHLGHSYGFSTPLESLQGLLAEFEALRTIAETTFAGLDLTLSVGATPTATAAQLLVDDEASSQVEDIDDVKARWTKLKQSRNKLEIHAGVYPFLDMQQLATQARISNLSEQNIGLRILVEVASLYTERSKPEALIAAGSLALGREPCKSYSGWGVVSPWSSLPRLASEAAQQHTYSPASDKRGWIVGRISQEHGLLTWEGDKEGMRELKIGEKLVVWPNHACVAGAGFGWYFVVDSDVDGGQIVQDVWVRCRGW